MPFAIEIDVQPDLAVPDLDALDTAVRATLRHESRLRGEITLLLADDEQLRELNNQFRGVDKATDVLSFPSGDSTPVFPGGRPYLGDIAISVPTAALQAEASGHSLTAELQLLAVHGVLHLLGYDHGDADEKAEMWAAQQAVLDELGLADISPTEV